DDGDRPRRKVLRGGAADLQGKSERSGNKEPDHVFSLGSVCFVQRYRKSSGPSPHDHGDYVDRDLWFGTRQSGYRYAFHHEEAVMRSPALARAMTLITRACPGAAQTFRASAGNLQVETVATGLSYPWGLAFLPDGRMLVTERPGRMRLVARDGKLAPPLAGVPRVFAQSQGGLHDVVLDRDHAQNQMIYFCYAEPAGGGGPTALAPAPPGHAGQRALP